MSTAAAERLHYVYVLYSGNRTYTGYTVDLQRRLKQHNGLLSGGAKSTAGHTDWQYLSITTCATWDARRALQVEYVYKHPDGKRRVPARYRGVQGRLMALPCIWQRILESDVQVQVCSRYFESTQALPVPDNVTLTELI